MQKIALYISIILLLTVQACSTKLDVNTKNARELVVVYGFLDANKTTQYIRINKGILGKDNEEINALSKDPSANLYGAGELDAYVQRGELVVKSGVTDTVYKEKYTLTETFYPRNSDGAFNLVFTGADSSRFKGNGVYQFSFASAPINDKKMRESVYKLVATVKAKNITATAITPLIYSVDTYDSSSISLSTLSSEFNNNQWFTNGIQLFTSNTSSDLAGTRAMKFSTVPSVNAYKYQVFYRQHITDYNNADSSLATSKRNYYVDIDCGYYLPEYYIDKNTKKYTLNLNIEPTVNSITGAYIATELSNAMKLQPYAASRKLGIASIVVYAIGEELKTYLDVNNANYGLNIDKPNYSNVTVKYDDENITKQGLGIFSCYTSGVKFYYDVNSTINNVYTKKTYRSNTFYLNLYSYKKIGLAAINAPYNFKYYYTYTNSTVPYHYTYNY
ncbi:MAG: hypothetical protein ABL940_06930 [Bacteroidia bacterium]